MKKYFRFKALAAACTVAMLAAGCGSSSDDSTPPTSPLPSSAQEDAAASASVAGFVAFIQSMIAALTLETNEPREIGGITPPVTETAEPTAI